jgi:hypothetical protein
MAGQLEALLRELWTACERGDAHHLENLILSGLTIDDARAQNNFALRWACRCGHLAVVDRLLELGLTLEDARAHDNYALCEACTKGHLEVVERLLSLGLTPTDARADDNFSLRRACMRGHHAVVCALAAAGVIEPTSELQVQTLEQIIRAPAETEDESEAARRAETRLAAARAAAVWPGHAEALAQLSDESAAAWEELYTEATPGPLRFAD